MLLLSYFLKYRVTIILISIIGGLFITMGAVPDSLYFNQQAIIHGQLWRLVTAHFVHSDSGHLVWNLAALLILSLLLEQDKRHLLLVSIALGIITIDYYLWFNSAGIINYAGFSGVLNTLLVVVLFQQLQKNAYLAVFIYLASLLKIIVEIDVQQAIFSHTSWQAIPEVHLIGFIIGTVIVLWEQLFNYSSPDHNCG